MIYFCYTFYNRYHITFYAWAHLINNCFCLIKNIHDTKSSELKAVVIHIMTERSNDEKINLFSLPLFALS